MTAAELRVFLAAVPQRAIRRHRRQALVPGHDFARDSSACNFSAKASASAAPSPDAPVHVPRQSDTTRSTFFSLHDLCDPLRRHRSSRGMVSTGCASIPQLIGNGDADARPAEVDPENAPANRKLAHCNSCGSLPIRFLIFSASCRWQIRIASPVRTTIRLCTPRSATSRPSG